MSDAPAGKTVGVLGGMGPEATVDFMSQVIQMTGAVRDQDHLRMIVDSNPGVPDRQAAIRGEGGDVGASLAEMAKGLELAGADFLVMPCNTAHHFADSIKTAVSLPFISIIDVTVAEIGRVCPDASKVGLMATAGCIDTGIYQRALQSAGYSVILPVDPAALLELIFRVKAGVADEDVKLGMIGIARRLVDDGADAIIAGCTEIPLVLKTGDLPVPLVSSTKILARETVEYAK